MFRENILVEFEDVGDAGRFLARAVKQQLLHPDRPLMQRLERPAETEQMRPPSA